MPERAQWDTLPGFSHITGGRGAKGAEARGGLGTPAAIYWAVAGKGCGPLFSPSPPVVTNPTERKRESESERASERGRDTQGKFVVRESAPSTESEDS